VTLLSKVLPRQPKARTLFWEETLAEKIPSTLSLWIKGFQKSRLDILGPKHHPSYLWSWSFKRSPTFWCFSGEFCLPQFDPEFLVTPESLIDDWSKFWIG
jgi:hypothetical protein